VARSRLWARLDAVAARLPRPGPNVVGIIHTYIAPGHLDKVAGISYAACAGYDHPLDGQSIMFDEPLAREEVPSPWRELLNGCQGEPFTFELDHAEQDNEIGPPPY
jgi:hypothetical protein